MKGKVLVAALLLVPSISLAEDYADYKMQGTVTRSGSDNVKVGDAWESSFRIHYDRPAYYSDEYATHYECIDNLTATVGGSTYVRRDPWEMVVSPGGVGFADAPIDGANLYLGFGASLQDDSLDNARDLESDKWSVKSWAMDVWESTWEGVRDFTSFSGEIASVWLVDRWKDGQQTVGPGYSTGTMKDGYPPGSDM